MLDTNCWSGDQIRGKRNYQEDFFDIISPRADTHQLVCVLADGMGGHAAGDVAAKLAVEAFRQDLDRTGGYPHAGFIQALDAANRAIASHASANREAQGMGTTLLALELDGNLLHWISVGDSVLYLVSETGVTRLNANHSMAPQLDAAAKRGEISVEEAMNSSSRNVLLSALTGDPIGRVDISRSPVSLDRDDIVILASDGIDTLTPDQIGTLLSNGADKNPKEICRQLLEAVTNAGLENQDNTTIIIAKPFALTFDQEIADDEVITRVVDPR